MSFFESKVRSALFVSAASVGAMVVAPGLAEASFGEKNLRVGMEEENVKVLQEKLKDKGYFNFHTATGYFGNVTRQAVQKFQKEHGLTQDGIVGPQTFRALNGTSSSSNGTQSSNSNSSSSGSSSSSTYDSGTSSIQNASQVMRSGTRNQDVSRLQSYLKKAGFYEHPEITGVYGNMTQQAVRKFQQARGLSVDGLAGPQTLSIVNREISGSAPSSGSSASSGSSSSNSSTSSNNSSSSSSSSNNSSATTSSSSSDISNVVLRQGARGSQVRELQTRLKDLGYYTSSVDGSFGPLTVQAVRQLQSQTNISVDGVFGPQTYRELEKGISNNQTSSSSNQSSSSNSSSPSVLKEGSKGSSVTELQNMLKATGHFSGNATGNFGPVTKAALVKFQNQWGLISDGIATKATLDKLEEVAAIHMSESTSSTSSSQSFNTMNLIADASDHLGVPYLWGGTTPSGFDCSGFIQSVFKNNGVNLPRTVAQQWNATKSVSTPRVGDIVYFETYRTGPSHNGIYIGNNQFIHSGSSTGVTVTSMSNSYWSQRYLGARRAN
ncbi:glycoside hydrolase [Salipaludibacillus keqinensis]|uniref:Glycoside hydrolase n=1 Tax=Salipaludibacillus keqinensis TaxID=2045207 RepID=A0A323TSW5_9BACI|nr:peptidoglycan-binding protein [Salipaludibacillus keqinensis]PYZ92535.1 glycoside hydrolase [Salipaludibacillus keqinensis]